MRQFRTSRVTVTVWVVVPLFPETVIVWFPSEALLPTVIVIVDVPAPVIDVGENVTLFWLPSPEADNAIAELNPPVTAVVMVTLPELLLAMLIVVGEALMEKAGVVPVTVSETVVVSTMVPEVPVTVIEYVPGTVLDPTVIDIVEVPVPVIEDGLNPMVTPVGWPEAVRVTAESKPPLTVLVMVELPALPGATETEVGDAESVKPDGGGPVRAVIRPAVGLPHPVTRS